MQQFTLPKINVRKGEADRTRELPWWEKYINLIGPLVGIILVCIIMAIFEPRYFRVANIMTILQDAAIFMVIGMALTIVITGAGIDLSIGAVVALSAVVMALLIKDWGVNVYVAMLVAILVVTACGFVNGSIVARLRVPDLIATLSMDLVYRGLALVLAAGAVLFGFDEPIPSIGRGKTIGGFPIPVIIGLCALLLGYFIYHYTKLGRYAIAIGGNREAAMLAGINVRRHKIYHYMLMGCVAGIAGIMLTGRLDAIQATAGMLLTLHAIAAVVVGGTVLFGGRGSMVGTLAGVILLAMIANALVTLRFAFFWQGVYAGIIITASVAFYAYLQQRGTGVRGM
jgi:ribose transport system permease protein